MTMTHLHPRTVTAAVLALSLLAVGGAANADVAPPRVVLAPAERAELRALFDGLQAAHRRNDAALLEKHVHPRAWRENFVGGSVTNMRRLFEQGVRKQLFLRPDLDGAVVSVGDTALIVS